ncbi:hypothetical protein EON83_06360 [bacterium]|nr:MAG: hypothetical protein EON83_06360 [bacterium]
MSSSAPPSHESTAFTPVGAPQRPGEGNWLKGFIGAVVVFLVVAILELNPIFYALSIVPVIISIVLHHLQRSNYDRIGWYVRQPIFTPQLPFELAGQGQKVLFGENDMKISAFMQPERAIPYSQILNVQLYCDGICLEGVALTLTDKTYFNDKTAPITILDKGNGERTRTALAILRAKIPQAFSYDLHWIEEGWVPRTGFTHPKAESVGGA